MLRAAALFALIAYVLSSCEPPDKDFHAAQCLDNAPIQVPPDTVSISPYPANPDVPVNLNFTYVNNYGTVAAVKADVTLEYFGNLLFKCGFHKINIPLKDLDGCKIVDNCPLTEGTHKNALQVDLSPFSSIIKTLADDTYYRLNVTVKDASNEKPVACLSAKFLLDSSS
eukprot:TRINITY_DN6082_c0_g1_i1.p2 TRINITY_DN6082_c0_g1~~TRINITY_DN6082_c0_g1_i1.p2  ORF type:complete len:169 (-),score=28.76 TRINITY_DN6082_c0_g1_i1:13-519(-)